MADGQTEEAMGDAEFEAHQAKLKALRLEMWAEAVRRNARQIRAETEELLRQRREARGQVPPKPDQPENP